MDGVHALSHVTGRNGAIVALVIVLGLGIAAGMIVTIDKATESSASERADASFEASRSRVVAEEISSRVNAAVSPTVTASADDRYFAELDQMNVPYAQKRKDLVIEDAHFYCNSLDSGVSYADLLAQQGKDMASISKINAAIDVYCPQFKHS